MPHTIVFAPLNLLYIVLVVPLISGFSLGVRDSVGLSSSLGSGRDLDPWKQPQRCMACIASRMRMEKNDVSLRALLLQTLKLKIL